MGGSQAQLSSAQLARTSGDYAKKAYATGFQGLTAQQGLLANAQAEPDYVKNAFAQQRVGLTEGGLQQSMNEIQGRLAQGQGAAQGGNTQQNLAPDQMGMKMAQALYGSRVQEGLGSLEQANKIMGMKLGLGVNTGNEAIGAAGNQLRNISMEPNYNKTYANVLTGINAAGAIYGAGNQAGWFNGSNGAVAGGVPGLYPDGSSTSGWGGTGGGFTSSYGPSGWGRP